MRTNLLATAALLLSTSFASADIITVTVTGTVASGSSLSGDAYTATWVVNTGTATEYISGGLSPQTTSPILSTTLAINGLTLDFGVGGYGVMYDFHNESANSSIHVNNGRYDAFYINTTITPGSMAMNSFVDSFGGSFSGNINAPWSYTINPITDNLDYPNHVGGSFSYNDLSGYLDPTTFTVTNPDYVPVVISAPLVQPPAAVPFPLVGAGLPGFIAALLFALLRRR